MRMTLIAILSAVALVGLATPVSAHDFAVTNPVTGETYYVDPHPAHVADGETDYSVWKETNGLDGLQKQAGFHPVTGEPFDADTCEINC